MKKIMIDKWLAGSIFGLIVIGIIMVYSASAFYAQEYFGDHLYFLKRHLAYLFLALVAMGIAYGFPYKLLRGWTWVPLVGSFAILFYLAFIVPGRWVHIGPAHFQGVDVAKFSLILFFADSFSRKEKLLTNYSEGLFPHLFYLAVCAALVVKQPDFSSSVMIIAIGVTMLLSAPVKIPHLALTGLSFVPAMVMAVLFSPYKLQRVLTFLNPSEDRQGAGYQIYQSMVSLGSGGIAGVGYARSTQKMFYLPEAHTDFIFAIIGEELGLLGTLLVVALFSIILVRGIRIARRLKNRYYFYLTVGVTAHLALYAIVNMMVTLHMVPATGLPLPFVSFGGTALLFSCIYAGILMRMSSESIRGSKESSGRGSSKAGASIFGASNYHGYVTGGRR